MTMMGVAMAGVAAGMMGTTMGNSISDYFLLLTHLNYILATHMLLLYTLNILCTILATCNLRILQLLFIGSGMCKLEHPFWITFRRYKVV